MSNIERYQHILEDARDFLKGANDIIAASSQQNDPANEAEANIKAVIEWINTFDDFTNGRVPFYLPPVSKHEKRFVDALTSEFEEYNFPNNHSFLNATVIAEAKSHLEKAQFHIGKLRVLLRKLVEYRDTQEERYNNINQIFTGIRHLPMDAPFPVDALRQATQALDAIKSDFRNIQCGFWAYEAAEVHEITSALKKSLNVIANAARVSHLIPPANATSASTASSAASASAAVSSSASTLPLLPPLPLLFSPNPPHDNSPLKPYHRSLHFR